MKRKPVNTSILDDLDDIMSGGEAAKPGINSGNEKPAPETARKTSKPKAAPVVAVTEPIELEPDSAQPSERKRVVFKRLYAPAVVPKRLTDSSVYTLYSLENVCLWTIDNNSNHTFKLGIKSELPAGVVAMLTSCPSLSMVEGVSMVGSPILIDENYDYEWAVTLHNHSGRRLEIKAGTAIVHVTFLNCNVDVEPEFANLLKEAAPVLDGA